MHCVPQALPQKPQLSRSVAVFTQVAPHGVNPSPQETHVPPVQTPPGQAFEQEQGLQNLTVRRDLLRQEIARLQDSLLSVRQTLQTRRANAEESLRLPIAELITIPSVRNDGEVIGETRRIAELEARMASGDEAAQSLSAGDPPSVSCRQYYSAVTSRGPRRMDS